MERLIFSREKKTSVYPSSSQFVMSPVSWSCFDPVDMIFEVHLDFKFLDIMPIISKFDVMPNNIKIWDSFFGEDGRMIVRVKCWEQDIEQATFFVNLANHYILVENSEWSIKPMRTGSRSHVRSGTGEFCR